MAKNDHGVTIDGASCPIPLNEYPRVLLAHGGGGRLSKRLLDSLIVPAFQNAFLSVLHDGASLDVNGARLAFSTDSYVVHPLFFPGGDIGELAVNGTVNDLAMCGARPLYLSVAFIIEEGLPMEDLARVVKSMTDAAARAGVMVVTGDTKVVDRGKGDQLFVTTTGIGVIARGSDIRPARATPGDAILVSGTIAEHGIAIMAAREELGSSVVSDTAPLHGLVNTILSACPDTHVLRDPTRGGVASALNEIATAAGVGMLLREEMIPLREEIKAACEIFGLDPLYVANEGKLIAIVPANEAEEVLAAMRRHPDGLGRNAVIIGEVVADHPGTVIMRSRIGGHRVVDMLSGEQLPRIC